MGLSFHGFDEILKMDWLVEHKAMVDFEMKQSTLEGKDGLEIVVVGEGPEFLSNMVSATKEKKMMGKGCEAYLAYVLGKQGVESLEYPYRKGIFWCVFGGVA